VGNQALAAQMFASPQRRP